MPFGDIETKKAWLAGFLVADGSITITTSQSRRGGWIAVGFTNTERELLDRVIEIVHDMGFEAKYTGSQPSDGKRKICYIVWLCGGYSRKAEFLKQLLPYLVGRKCAIAELVLLLIESRGDRANGRRFSDWEDEICDNIRYLNKRGIA